MKGEMNKRLMNPVRISRERLGLLVSSIQDKCLKSSIIQFFNLNIVEEQLKFLKQMSTQYSSALPTNQEIYKFFMEFVIEIYVGADVKHPLKNYSIGLLSSTPVNMRDYILLCFKKRLSTMIADATHELLKDVSTAEKAVSTIMICLSNFSIGTQAVMSLQKEVLSFLVQCLETHFSGLQKERATSVREDLYRFTQNAARTIFVFLQNGRGGQKGETSIAGKFDDSFLKPIACSKESYGSRLQRVLAHFLIQEELPLDVRNTCALALASFCALSPSKLWHRLLKVVMGETAAVPPWMPAQCAVSALARLALCVGLLGSLSSTVLVQLPARSMPLAVISYCILELAYKKPTFPALELGVSRALNQVLRIVSAILKGNKSENTVQALNVIKTDLENCASAKGERKDGKLSKCKL